jgi:hypothetical protein
MTTIREQLRALSAANDARPRDMTHYGFANDANPVTVFAEKSLRDPHDPDSALMRAALRQGHSLRDFAETESINLHGDQWVDPAALGGHVPALTATFNRIALSPAYRAWEDDCTDTLVRSLSIQDRFHKSRREWFAYSTTRRLDEMAWFSREQQKTFAADLMPPAIICLNDFSLARTTPPHPRVVRGMHTAPGPGRRSHDLCFNTHPDAQFHIFKSALETAFHENLHASQYSLAGAVARGAIAPTHPLYREGRLFAMAFNARSCYLPNLAPAYRAHPLEADTHAQTDRFIRTLKAARP